MKRQVLLHIVLLLLAGWLVACVPTTITPTSTDQSEELATAVAQTLIAQLTLSAGETAVARLTEMAAQPVVTLVLPTPLPPSATPEPTSTPTTLPTPQPSPTATPVLFCDHAALIADVSASSDALLPPGGSFTKVWRVQNIGSCTWTPAYALAFVNGAAMGGQVKVGLPAFVNPGQMVDIAVNLTAPDQPGFYQGEWMLQNAGGLLFGTGSDALGTFPVRLQVMEGVRKGVYDLALNMCLAEWRSQAGLLPCPGNSTSENGSVTLLNDPDLESRRENELTLWMRPYGASDGWISGQYPPMQVRYGDRFLTEVGCLDGNPLCDVFFQLEYQTSAGIVRTLGTWREVYDQQTTQVDVDLSSLAGQTIQLILSVENRGRANQANAFWFVPQIRTLPQAEELVLIWRQEGGPNRVCEELRLYLVGRSRSDAQAYSCRSNGGLLGSQRLSDSDHGQLLDWVARLSSFEGQTYTPSSSDPFIVSLSLKGAGDADAFSSDIQAITKLAERIFDTITQ